MILRLFIVRLAVVLGLASGQAVAQWQEPEGLRITREEFERHAAALEFTVAQREAAEMMFGEYAREFDDAWKTQCELSGWLWSNTSSSSWYGGESAQAFGEVVRDEGRTLETQWRQGGRALEAAYFDRLAQVAIGREAMVGSLQRKHLRDRLLTKQPILDEYELAIHECLRRYEEALPTWRQRLDNAGRAKRIALQRGEDTPEAEASVNAFVEVFTERYRHTVELWPLQETTAQRIVACLSPAEQDAFNDILHVKLRRFLLPEKGSPIEDEFKTALGRDDLTVDQRARLEELQRAYRAARSAATPRLQSAYMQTLDLAFLWKFYRLQFGNRQKEAGQLYHEVDDAWAQVRDGWLQQCDATRESIRTVIAAREKATP
jgi:hypothetical protein